MFSIVFRLSFFSRKGAEDAMVFSPPAALRLLEGTENTEEVCIFFGIPGLNFKENANDAY